MGLPGISGGPIAQAGGLVSGLMDAGSASVAGMGFFDALTPKASEIFEKRTATRIFNTHQKIALENIEGSQFPKFDENQNLYGFTIFQFKSGFFGGGWAQVNVNTLLGFDMGSAASGLLGGDQVANVQSYFFNMHPSSINLNEPFATHLVPTQGGGVYAESQGSILKQLTLSGTTGYRPARVHTVTSELDNVIEHEVDEPTGYLNFLKLRNLFRNYSDLKRTKSLAYKTYLIWYNNKEQEAWFFEPSEFTTSRDASSPFTYDYHISGTLIQKVNFSTIVNTLHPDPNSPHFWVASMRKSAALVNGIVGNLFPIMGDDVIGEIFGVASSFLELVDDVDNFITQMVMTGAGFMALPLLAVGMAGALVWEVKNKINTLFSDEGKYSTMFGLSNAQAGQDLFAKDSIWAQLINLDNALSGTYKSMTKLLVPEGISKLRASTSVSAGRLAENNKADINTNPEYLDDGSKDWKPFAAPTPDEDFEAWVYEKTGNAQAFDAVVLYNNLQYPYITETPSYQNGFNKFLTPGDIIYLPMEKEYISGDINTVINPAKAALNTYEEILGRDLKLTKLTQATTGVSEFNLSISPNGDLDIIVGKDNIEQAIDIKLNTERGELMSHPGFGIVPVVGHKGSKNVTFNLHLSLYDTMLSDGRIKELTDTYVNISGDKASVKTKVHVIGHVPYVPLVLTMG